MIDAEDGALQSSSVSNEQKPYEVRPLFEKEVRSDQLGFILQRNDDSQPSSREANHIEDSVPNLSGPKEFNGGFEENVQNSLQPEIQSHGPRDDEVKRKSAFRDEGQD